MNRLFPYDTLFGDLTLKVDAAAIDGTNPDVHMIDLNADALDLFLVERSDWKRSSFSWT